MPLTTRARYAARIMVYLARHSMGAPVTKHEIARGEGISANYVEQIMIRLKADQLVRSHRGRNGGFSLGRAAESILLADVLRAVDGPVTPAPCLRDSCEREGSCPTRPVWKKAAEAVEEVLAGTTIAEIAKQAGSRAVENLQYQI